MRILVLTFYYEPDLCAGSFRATALVRALNERAGPGKQIDVLTTWPNRYSSFKCEVEEGSGVPAVNVVRFRLPAHRSGMLDQSRAFGAYAAQAIEYLRGRRYDVICATSSRLMTALLGAVVSQWKRAPLYLDIRDIFVDTLQDILSPSMSRALLPMFRTLESYALQRAAAVNLVSEGFRGYFEKRYPGKRFRTVPNGIDKEFYAYDFGKPKSDGGRTIVLYAGNIGEGQGLDRVLPELAKRCRTTHEFWVVGDGGARGRLEAAVNGQDNVRLIAPVARKELLSLYRRSDILFLHLNDYPAFRRVLPSKLFEYAATGKRILAGVGGYAAEFLGQVPGAAIFPPCNVEAGYSALTSLASGTVSRGDFMRTFRRSDLMRALADDIVAVAQGRRE